jgi:hypothetical protein
MQPQAVGASGYRVAPEPAQDLGIGAQEGLKVGGMTSRLLFLNEYKDYE